MISIKAVYPEIEGDRFPVKTELDRPVEVAAVIQASAKINLFLKYRTSGSRSWEVRKMKHAGCDRYAAVIKPKELGMYYYTVEAAPVSAPRKITRFKKIIPLMVEPVNARYAAWYEMFHRSQGRVRGKSATFKDCEKRLGYVKTLGFNVIYFPPIHPIGHTHRKGPNNALKAGPNDPGCPWAIGNEDGGHKAVNPELGTLADFEYFVAAARDLGFAVALDIALNCSPDHPYITEHPQWFFYRKDGSIRSAENPPKKYEDTCPLNFSIADPKERRKMWREMKSIFIFWASRGVTIFRIDNPHTKPTEFWTWVVKEVKREYPQTVFLAEAFTEFDKMELLARVGFTQSYTYFTWRNGKNELIEYFSKLTGTKLNRTLRANLFCNTPDINPPYLQTGGRPAFRIRAALASTLSSVWAIYNGYELCESAAVPGTESFIYSEKYDYKVWDWNRKGNIKKYISKLNEIRRDNPALHLYDNLVFLPSTNDNIICYSKIDASGKNILVIVVNVNPFDIQNTRITVPLESCGLNGFTPYRVTELITGVTVHWQGDNQYIRLEPRRHPAYIFRIDTETSPRRRLPPGKTSRRLAVRHGRKLFSLGDKYLLTNDPYKKMDIDMFYSKTIVPRIFFGPRFDPVYLDELNKMSKKNGYPTIFEAYFAMPGK